MYVCGVSIHKIVASFFFFVVCPCFVSTFWRYHCCRMWLRGCGVAVMVAVAIVVVVVICAAHSPYAQVNLMQTNVFIYTYTLVVACDTDPLPLSVTSPLRCVSLWRTLNAAKQEMWQLLVAFIYSLSSVKH